MQEKIPSLRPVNINRLQNEPKLRPAFFLEIAGQAHRHTIQGIPQDVGRNGCGGKEVDNSLEMGGGKGNILAVKVSQLKPSNKVDESLSRFNELMINPVHQQLKNVRQLSEHNGENQKSA